MSYARIIVTRVWKCLWCMDKPSTIIKKEPLSSYSIYHTWLCMEIPSALKLGIWLWTTTLLLTDP